MSIQLAVDDYKPLVFSWKKNRENPEGFVFIPYNVPSSKNSKRWVGMKLIHSKTTVNYIRKTGTFWMVNRIKFKKLLKEIPHPPYFIAIGFIRNSARLYDWVNPVQTVQDLMVKYQWIFDDNTNIMYPVPMVISEYDNEVYRKGGVVIKILKTKNVFTNEDYANRC